ncbi:MAG: L,D-transpeptidase/peptidoglycan binding protein [Lachnospiraceae bacterium]|nr:L,D-transpeptidase/peptidoglycan binding protein [Lachnospiraceae bacterium]
MMKQKFNRKQMFMILSAVCVPVLCILAIYLYGMNRYKSCFMNGTVIDQIDVSGMTISQLTERIQGYVLQVEQRQPDGTVLVEDISGADIGLTYASMEPFEKILEDQNNLLWFIHQGTEQITENMITYDAAALETKIKSLSGFRRDFIVEPENAYISDYIPGTGFEIIAETLGTRLNRQKTFEVIQTAVEGLEEYISLSDAGCYETAKITADNADLNATLEELKKYTDITITYTFGDQQEVLDGDTIVTWIETDGSEITLDETKVADFVEYLRKTYNTIFTKRTFQTSYDIEVTIDKGDYGWWLNTVQETAELTEMIQKGESGERTPVYYQTAASYDTPDYGDTYVEINLTAQHLLLYVDGEMILESDFVSGNASRGYDTPAGIYGLTYKQRDATLSGPGYRTPVSYWMPFNNNIGMHDASWRKSFGGNIYKTNGSHGCINLPYSVAEEIYGYIEKGTPVICYYLPGTEPVVKEKPAETTSEVEQEPQEPVIDPLNPAIDPSINPQEPVIDPLNPAINSQP